MAGYREIAPSASLAGLLECAWQGRSGDVPRTQRVLPDGCMDLIVLGVDARSAVASPGADARSAGASLGGPIVVAGPDTAAHLAHTAAGSVTTGLRFRPGALPALLGVPAEALRDRRAPLSDVLGAERDITALGRLAEAPGVPLDDLAFLVATASALRARDRRPLPEPLPRPALRALARGMPAVELADRLGVTSRTLHRRCLATLGYGPSVARRVLRFRAASGMLFAGVAPAEVAARVGYADQPHLSREVRDLAGVSPAALAPS